MTDATPKAGGRAVVNRAEAVTARCASIPCATLTSDELDDAAFRLKDRAWASLVKAFDESSMRYEAIAARIRHPAEDVLYWLKDPTRLTIELVGLLAEALDCDMVFDIVPRSHPTPETVK